MSWCTTMMGTLSTDLVWKPARVLYLEPPLFMETVNIVHILTYKIILRTATSATTPHARTRKMIFTDSTRQLTIATTTPLRHRTFPNIKASSCALVHKVPRARYTSLALCPDALFPQSARQPQSLSEMLALLPHLGFLGWTHRSTIL